MLYLPELRLTLQLQAGDALLFDNQRVLHGRTAYREDDPPRAVLTSSVDLEEFYSTLRTLQQREQGQVQTARLSQGLVG